MFGALYQSIMGHPLVYNKIRPFFLGGLDLSPFYNQITPDERSVILDVGCGTGNALDYLSTFARYEGFDTDPVAIRSARARPDLPSNVSFEDCYCTKEHVAALNPSHVLLCGVLHHLTDEEAVNIMKMATEQPAFQRLFTLDIVMLPGASHALSNTLASLDRGKHVRKPEGYRKLIESAGLSIQSELLPWNHPKRHVARYFVTTAVSRGRAQT